METLTILVLIALVAVCIMMAISMLIAGPSSLNHLMSELKMKDELNPMTPLQNLNEKVSTINRTIKYNKYIQHQLKKNGKWVLHNLNGPAVYNLKTKESFFFIDGIQYDDELQYLVARETYENTNSERRL